MVPTTTTCACSSARGSSSRTRLNAGPDGPDTPRQHEPGQATVRAFACLNARHHRSPEALPTGTWRKHLQAACWLDTASRGAQTALERMPRFPPPPASTRSPRRNQRLGPNRRKFSPAPRPVVASTAPLVTHISVSCCPWAPAKTASPPNHPACRHQRRPGQKGAVGPVKPASRWNRDDRAHNARFPLASLSPWMLPEGLQAPPERLIHPEF